jgi:O-acetylhomoserine/O-acetylserine sulfhydrylase-like pyridoxal-dependent enzyme
MSFPNPDNYARDCDCGTAGVNTAPPPAIFQAEIDSLDTRVTALEETNDVIVSSGGIDALTTAQQALIREGSWVVTSDGREWVYSGTGSKVLEASYHPDVATTVT